jgi:hypothetical protein
MHAKLFRTCLVLGIVLVGVQLPTVSALDTHAILSRIHIDWAPLEQYFDVSDIHLGEREFRIDGSVLVEDALMFRLEAKAKFQWYDIPTEVRFYDVDNRELLPRSYLRFDPPSLMSTGWQPGTRCSASVSLAMVDLSQVKTIRFFKRDR